jgi:PleD family two-component response regulator
MEAEGEPITDGNHRPRVLVVDHIRTNLAVMMRRIGEAGYRVTAADCGANAIAELHRKAFDIVIAELYMPGIDGAELTMAIRGQAPWRDLPVMLITGKSEPRGAVRGYEAGADDVILKPFHFEVLIARIERRLARIKSMHALREDNAALDARIVTRAIELGEMRDRWLAAETERQRLAAMVREH